MRSFLKLLRSRIAALLGACGLVLTQAACAHPVVVEPSVVVQARLGGPVYGSVVTPVYGSAPVVVAPSPVWMAPRPPMPTPMPYGVWSPPSHRHHHWHGQGLGHGWGRREGFGR